MPKQSMQVLTVVYAKSLARVSAFYEPTLQLERAEVEATHVLLSNGEMEVAVIQAPESIAEGLVVAVPPEPRAPPTNPPAPPPWAQSDEVKRTSAAAEICAVRECCG